MHLDKLGEYRIMLKNKTLEFITEACGWYGVVAIIAAYGLLSFGVLESHGLTYQLLNLTGGIGIVIDAIADKNTQPAVLNTIWAVFALIAIARIIFLK